MFNINWDQRFVLVGICIKLFREKRRIIRKRGKFETRGIIKGNLRKDERMILCFVSLLWRIVRWDELDPCIFHPDLWGTELSSCETGESWLGQNGWRAN